jgi:YHS domain-containing protein
VPFKYTLCKDEIIEKLSEKIKDEGKQYYFVIEVDHKFVKEKC